MVKHRLERTFHALREEGRKALVVYVCVGDPSVEGSLDLAAAAVQAGADIIELGVPFSDSTGQGPVVARAAGRAIAQGASLYRVMEGAKRLAARVDAPVVLSTHHAPMLVRGARQVVRLAREGGLAALLVVDLPPGDQALVRAASDVGLAIVPYATLTEGETVELVLRERAERPTAPRGYVHLVARSGAMGLAREDLDAPDAPPPSTRALGLISARVQAAAMRARSELPVVVGSALGSGIDSGASARKAVGPRGEGADGVVVDGAITRIVEDSATDGERIERVRALVTALRAALDEPPAWA